jgi:hypothetical protein
MLDAIQNLPFIVKKLIQWILPFVLGFLSLLILSQIIAFTHTTIAFFITTILISPYLLSAKVLQLLLLIELIRVPTYALMGSFIVVRSSSRRLGGLLFPEFKKKRTTS